MRAARRVLQAGAVAIVLAAVPAPLFDLDRYQVPKELVLHVAAFGAGALALRRARRIPVSLADLLLVAFAVISAVSAALAPNGWLAFRAIGVTLSSLAIFWTAQAVARAGLERPLLITLAGATVLGAVTGLLQAYGIDLPMTAAARAPGGTFGNRNFMAHLTAIGLPALVLIALQARSRAGAALAIACTGLSGAALLLSRSRAAWLAVAVGLVFFVVEGLVVNGLWQDPRLRRRLAGLAVVALAGVALAMSLPNALEWKSQNPYFESLVGVANYREGSGRGRLVQYGNTLRMANEHPVLGVGPGNWPVAYPRYTTPGDPAFDWNDPIPTNPWPSSDWVAHAAERGLPALGVLVLAGLVIAFVGWRRSRQLGRERDGLAALTLVATLLVTVVVGAFDAVLLLAAPGFFAWAIMGTLMPPQRAVVTLSPGTGLRRIAIGALLLTGAAFVMRTTLQTASMVVAGSGGTLRALQWGARLDPGSYRLHYLAAEAARRRCRVVRVHAERARELFPEHTAPVRLLRRCPAGSR